MIAADEHGCMTCVVGDAGAAENLGGHGNAALSKQSPRSHQDLAALMLANDPLARSVVESGVITQGEFPLAGTPHDGFAKRMLGVLFGDGRGLENFVFGNSIKSCDGRYFGRAKGQSAGLARRPPPTV